MAFSVGFGVSSINLYREALETIPYPHKEW